jgi:hypothetical protein
LVSIFFVAIFFCFGKFFNLDFFIISFSNIKLVRNWALLLNQGLEFHGLRVWIINPNLENLSEFPWFFFLFFLVNVFSILFLSIYLFLKFYLHSLIKLGINWNMYKA